MRSPKQKVVNTWRARHVIKRDVATALWHFFVMQH